LWFCNFFEVVHESHAKIRNQANVVTVEVDDARRGAGKPEDAPEFVEEQPAVEA
jgi:hypothetical protein